MQGQDYFSANLQAAQLNPGLAAYFGVKEGVLVVNVADDNVYQLKPGDVVLEVGGRAANSPRRLSYLLRTYEPGEQIQLTIMRNKKKRTLTVQASERK